MTTGTKSQDDDRAIDKLEGALGKVQDGLADLRVEIARSNGSYTAKLDEMAKDLKSLSELYGRVGAAEKDGALLRERVMSSEEQTDKWRSSVESRMTTIADDVQSLNRFKWLAMGALIILEVIGSLFGATIHASLWH